MKKIASFAIISLQIFTTAFSQSTNLHLPIPLDPNVRTGTLENGLKYYIRHNEKPDNRVELRMAVNTGSTMEDDDQRGLAHFVEHMAFNGSKNFAKNELIDYLESIGTKFGPHLNAYTSFDETVYMMQVPTDNAEYVTTGMQILEDWAHNLSFDAAEIDKERGVVVEEWRLGQGADERMNRKTYPVLFMGSRYEHRLPIGKKEIVEGATHERIKQFYYDWYRPDNMAIIIVGDVDVDAMEATVKKHFEPIKNPAAPRPVQAWAMPDSDELRIVNATDKEATNAAIEIIYKHNLFAIKTQSDYRQMLINRLYNSMLGGRLGELRKSGNPPFTFGNSSFGGLVRTKSAYSSFAMVAGDGIERGLRALLDENERVRQHGFTQTELDRSKLSLMRSIESALAEKDKTESSRLVGELVQYFLSGAPVPGIEFTANFYKTFLEGVQLTEVNAMAQKWINNQGKNCTVIITAPEKEGVAIPDDNAIRKIFSETSAQKMAPYIDEMPAKPLIEKMPAAGTIVAETYNKEFDYSELKLSNGARIFWKKTDFKNDQVMFSASSFGGTGKYSDSEYYSALFASSVVQNSGIGNFTQNQYDKYKQGKIAAVNTSIGETSESFNGSASPKDLEFLFQQIHTRFQTPRTDVDGFNSFIKQQNTFLENRSVDPGNAFQDSVRAVMNNYHKRRMAVTSETLKLTNHQRALEIFNDRFNDAGDFVFAFVGNFDEAILRNFVTLYIASLPAGEKENWTDIGVTRPSGKVERTVHRGIEPKSSVSINFYGKAEYTAQENMDMQSLMKLMQIKLRESLREEQGGTYGVGCNGFIARIPKVESSINVSFGCGPENVQSLTAAAFAEIEKVKQNGCSEEDLVKIRENFKREREIALSENSYWLQRLLNRGMYSDEIMTQKEFDDYYTNLDSDDLKNLAIRFFDLANYGYFVLVPEK